ncbi:MAG: hypothetical protein IJX26_02990 [Clostridia bacterium]|nr:hypothetical protein [Clostridia bacterium]
MIKTLSNTSCFKKLGNELNSLVHAYLIYSNDKLLNNYIAELFAMKIFCEHSAPCFECEACKKSLVHKNPDLIIVEKDSINVDDVKQLIETSQLKPMIYKYKIILIKNAETISEIAQNKLLKSLEEANSSLIFILTTSDETKILATVKSRLKKLYLAFDEVPTVSQELLEQGVNKDFLTNNYTLTEIVENSQNNEYLSCVENLNSVFNRLKTTQDIAQAVNDLKLNSHNKVIYIKLLLKLFSNSSIFNKELLLKIEEDYPLVLRIKIQRLIEDSYRKIMANVNANYVFDNLFYNILKEKYLCKQ